MCQFLQQHQMDLIVMESTGIYWKSIYASIINCHMNPWVVNARHVKNVPGRKTDVLDSQWLAHLAHCGLVRPSGTGAIVFTDSSARHAGQAKGQ